MNESRASLQGGMAGAAEGGGLAGNSIADSGYGAYDQGHVNPFTDPGDDRIFTFKDEERTRKEHER